MRIQHNIAALNAHRYLSSNNDAVAKNLEKLSSGYRINRAGDDAAGLSISEKMRAQIKGLETATKNAQDGVSLVQTAEGNLTEVHSMLNRMVELSTQAANGTYQDLNREEIQKEVVSLTSEIDRISSSANFNGIKLLDGSLSTTNTPDATGAFISGATKAFVEVPATTSKFELNAAKIEKGTEGTTQTLTVAYKDESGKSTTKDITYKAGKDADSNAEAIVNAIKGDGTLSGLFDITGDGKTAKLTFTSKTAGASGAQITGLLSSDSAAGLAASLGGAAATVGADAHKTIDLTGLKAGDFLTVNGKTYQMGGAADKFAEGAIKVDTAGDAAKNLVDALKKDGVVLDKVGTTGSTYSITADPAAKKGLTLQIGESNDSYQQVKLTIGKMDAKSLGLNGVDLSSQDGALSAIDVVSKAIDKVSATRGSLGAVQNRLDHTINNLSVTDENMAAAESRIRDVDMAKEMMDFTKNNILTQAAQSMLAQANTLPQGVLQLLR